MATLGAAEHLTAWDAVRSAPDSQRPQAILRAFGVYGQPSLGHVDAELLAVYADNFGPRLDGVSCCPHCGTDVELGVDVAELRASIAPPTPVEPLLVDGERIEWRLPDESDLAAAAATDDVEAGARMLMSRCITRGPGAGGGLPEGLRDALAERIAAADHYTDLTFALTCPACAGSWDSTVDVAEFVGRTLNLRACRLRREVDALARRYGWSEDQILALPQPRRDAYLELVRDG